MTISVAKYSVIMTHHNAASGRHLIPETRCQDAGFFITVRNEVGKVFFLHLSVILSTGEEGLPQCMLGYHHPPPGPGTPQSRDPPWDQVPPEQTPPRTSPPGADPTPLGPGPPEQTPPRDGYLCGWYASYWNSFLFK